MLNAQAVATWVRLGVVLGAGGAASASDLRTRRVPNAVSVVACTAGLVLATAGGVRGLVSALAGAAAFGGPLLAFWLAGCCGAGDAKLGLALGALLGFPAAAGGLLCGTALGGAWCLIVVGLAVGRGTRSFWQAARCGGALGVWAALRALPVWRASLPYAAFLAAGAAAAGIGLTRGGGGCGRGRAGRLRRIWSVQAAMAPIVEFLFMLLLLLGFFGGFTTYALALHARSVLIEAAFAAARTASLECDPSGPAYSPGWLQDATAAAQGALQAGRLTLGAYADPRANARPGTWYVTASCQGGVVDLALLYNQLDVFPVLGPVLLAGQAHGWSFLLQSGAQLPAER
jgi:leader peptidase (prepilin peptidase)/N-methyltransferase